MILFIYTEKGMHAPVNHEMFSTVEEFLYNFLIVQNNATKH